MTKKVTFRDLLVSDHFELLKRSADQKIAAPVYYSRGDLSQLFEMTHDDLRPAHTKDFETLSDDDALKLMGQDGQNIKAQTSGKTFSGVATSSSLLSAFALWGCSSSIGRTIECAAKQVDAQGNMVEDGLSFISPVTAENFRQFEDNPISGAQSFFRAVHDIIGAPQRAVCFGFISPPPARH